jgi:hypothetical protein
MDPAVPTVITRYFDLDADRRIDAIVALFTPDATVFDEGEARHGTDAIRGWQTGAASEYEYTTTITGHEQLADGRWRVRGRLEGNFPGGVADLNFDFTVAGEQISRLEIAP